MRSIWFLPILSARPRLVLACAVIFLSPLTAFAGGPRYIAGASYFNPAAMGQPVHWAGGQVNYYVDQGPLSASVSNQQATAMVDAAAALWSAVPTAAVTLTDMGPLNEDVSAANIQANSSGQITAPADVTPSATNYPLAVIFDADGSVINAIIGLNASQPDACQTNGVYVWIDNFSPDATIAHGVILLNGLCATSADLLEMMRFQIERAFGRILGLDNSQVNPGALSSGEPGGTLGWPVMQPISGVCGATGGACIPNPATLSYDDIATLNRIYPITAANLASFPGKQLTAANTISIQGKVAFVSGYGMQGVNVVARPLDSNGNPLYQYTVTAVTGAQFSGNHGNPVTGFTDYSGNALSMWGSNDPSLQGFFDLSGIPLPPGATSASYEVSFEAIDPLYILSDSVGPYTMGQVAPSGTLQATTLPNLSAGSTQTVDVTAAASAAAALTGAIGSESQPRPMPVGGQWAGRLSQIGQTDWFTFPVRGNRIFTVVTQALDESGSPSNAKAMPSIGIWDAFDPVGAASVGAAPGLNGNAPGETWLRVATNGDDIVRIGIADLRGDGRPDYAYDGWLLYADSVSPARLPASGGPITIEGMGFRIADTVLVGGQTAQVTSISPNQITAIAPPAASGVTGSVDVEVDDQPAFYAAAIIPSGISYDSGSGDALTLFSAPSGTVPIGLPIPFTVTALGPSLAPAGGATVIFTVTSGTATLACGLPVCSIVATGDGRATMNVIANDGTWSIVTASLTNGSSLQAQFAGGTPPVLAATDTPSQIALRLLDMDGNPMAGGTVALYQALYAWSPPCAPHTVCTQGALLSSQASSATSALDGSVTFAPISMPGVATSLLGVAASGSTATVSIAVEQHP